METTTDGRSNLHEPILMHVEMLIAGRHLLLQLWNVLMIYHHQPNDLKMATPGHRGFQRLTRAMAIWIGTAPTMTS